MKIYLCIDDTDTKETERGTGRLGRMFVKALPWEVSFVGVVRQQLPRLEGIPFTSNNSSACLVLEAEAGYDTEPLIERAAQFLAAHFVEGSDPGLCVVTEEQPQVLAALLDFAREASNRVVTQAEAHAAAEGGHLSGHGGTEDGVIGAAAGVGLTADAWSGRFIELGHVDLRALPDPVSVSALQDAGIRVLGMDRDTLAPSLEDNVVTHDWVRPQLWGGRPVLAIRSVPENGGWEVAMRKLAEDPEPDGAAELP